MKKLEKELANLKFALWRNEGKELERSIDSSSEVRNVYSKGSFASSKRSLGNRRTSMERLSDKLNDRVVRMVEEKEKKNRRENIVIRGVKLKKNVDRFGCKSFLKEK